MYNARHIHNHTYTTTHINNTTHIQHHAYATTRIYNNTPIFLIENCFVNDGFQGSDLVLSRSKDEDILGVSQTRWLEI